MSGMAVCPCDLEGIARSLHDSTGIECPVDAFALTALCGLETRPWSRSNGEIVGDLIRYPGHACLARQHEIIAHELAHWLLRVNGQEWQCEASARYLACAIILPREQFGRDIARTECDLLALMALHPNATAEMCAARLCHLITASISLYSRGSSPRRYWSEYAEQDKRADDELAQRTRESGIPVRDHSAEAWPLTDESGVIVVRRTA